MKKNFKKASVALLMSSVFAQMAVVGTMGLASSAFAQETNIGVTGDANKVSAFVPLTLNRELTTNPNMFHIENSNKVVVDFFDSKSLLKEAPTVTDNPLIQSVVTKEVGDRTRVIFDFKQPVTFGFSKSSGLLTLNFISAEKFASATTGGNVSTVASAASASPVNSTSPVIESPVVASIENRSTLTGLSNGERQRIIAQVAAANGNGAPVYTPKTLTTVDAPVMASSSVKSQVDKINFKKEKGKTGKLTIDFSDSQVTPVVTRSNNSLIIELKNTSISQEMQKRINAQVLGTSTQVVDISMQQGNGRIVLEQKEGWDFSVYQFDKKLSVEVRTLSEYDAYVKSQEGKDSYKGKPLSINFQSMDVRTILQVIADFSKLNILTSDAVTGNMTVRLQDVPWDQALDLILEAKNLQKVKQGNVVWIATRAEVSQKNDEQIKQQNQIADLEPLKLETFQLNHHKAEDVLAILNAGSGTSSTTSAGAGSGTLSILSKRGSVGIDKRNNMIFVQDIASKIEEVKKLLKRIDVTTRQVLIEAKIVIADDKWGKSLGAKFGVGANKVVGNRSFGLGSNYLDGQSNANLGTSSTGGTVITNPLFSGAAAAGAGSIGFTILNMASGAALSLELSALESDNRGKVLSNPRLLTTDNKKALLEQGTEIPYVTPGSANSPPTVTFKKAVLSLGVTPQISPNGRIIMNLQIRKDTVGELVNVQGGGQVPSIDTRNIDTQVTVNNGQTVVLGGVYEITNRTDAQKVPFLGDIPVLGYLFKQNAKSEQKAELLIFITPQVVEDEDLDRINEPTTPEEIELKR
jgi:type IV pilus assembly protein PilQ